MNHKCKENGFLFFFVCQEVGSRDTQSQTVSDWSTDKKYDNTVE